MFKKITALFLVMSFTQVYAVTPVQQTISLANEMNRAFDDLNYRLNVEWDQSDSKFIKVVYDDFGKEIAALQAQGLSAKELTQYTLEKIKDQQTRVEVEAITKTINENQMNPAEARDFAISKLSNMYAHGASWSGGRIRVHHVALILGMIALIYCVKQMHGEDGRDGINGTNGTDGTDGTNGNGCPDGYYYKINGKNGTAICHKIKSEEEEEEDDE